MQSDQEVATPVPQELLRSARGAAAEATDASYLSGFGNEHATEALPGALPVGRNSPQKLPYGLYAEQVNGSAFTVPRSENQRSWLYRIYPTAAAQGAWARTHNERLDESDEPLETSPERCRWRPWTAEVGEIDFVDGLFRLCQSGGARERRGMSLYVYAANRSMRNRVFSSVDGELIILPQQGSIRVRTEMGNLRVEPGEMVLLPRGIRFSVELQGDACKGFVCENLGMAFRLPERGLIGANGLANARDFLAPVAAYEVDDTRFESIAKFGGRIWSSTLSRTPFDVVAWHGTYAPFKYDMRRFNAVHSVSYDHTDPSVFTALTSPSGIAGVANVDFAVLPPRWIVANETFRPPYYHRNIMSEIVVSLRGAPESRGTEYHVGSCHVHNAMAPHGPDPEILQKASNAPLAPRWEDTLMVMFESFLPYGVPREAAQARDRDTNYESNWDGTPVLFENPSSH